MSALPSAPGRSSIAARSGRRPPSSARRSGVSRVRASGAGSIERAHRRVQRGRAPQQVVGDPADVVDQLVVVGAVRSAACRRSRWRAAQTMLREEQVEGGLALAGVDGQADRPPRAAARRPAGRRSRRLARAPRRRERACRARSGRPTRAAPTPSVRISASISAGAVARCGLRRRTSSSRPTISAG